jgi:acyl dehydratase
MDLRKLIDFNFPPVEQTYSKTDSIIYAVGLGYGTRPLDSQHLRFVYEEGIQSVPSMCVVLGYPGFWLREPQLGADWVRMLHAEHYFEVHQPLPADGTINSTHRLIAVNDKGPEKGALVYVEKKLTDRTGAMLATVRQTLFLRGDGGCGDFGVPPTEASALPQRVSDKTLSIETYPNSALLYRLNGDWNPIHADPKIAAAAGFDRPILHGLCSMGLATRAVIECFCGGDPLGLRSMFVRFSKPVIPSDTVKFEFYSGSSSVSFRAVATERDVVVLDRCIAQFY